LELPEPVFQKKSLNGQVLYVDRFGNLVTNLSQEAIKHYFQRREITVRIGRRVIPGIKESYAQEKPGRLLALLGSNDTLEIACNLGSAAERMGYIPGKILDVKVNTGSEGNI
jgi:S-adenosyl-L-methionine hydrolase (adenosine-forming)